MDVRCSFCGEKYNTLGSGKQPRVMSCGDSICSYCLRLFTQQQMLYEFQCVKCSTKINSNEKFPLNKLYYEMQSYFKQHLKLRQWDSPSVAKLDDQMGKEVFRYDQKCLNPFCVRPKYQNDDIMELFCSRMCKQSHQELYQN